MDRTIARSQTALEEASKHDEFETKKKKVVIERLPLDADLGKIVREAVENESFTGKADFIKTYRHSGRDGKPTKIAKVEFDSEKAAREFMTKFRSLALENIKQMKPMPFARRDMTPAERTV